MLKAMTPARRTMMRRRGLRVGGIYVLGLGIAIVSVFPFFWMILTSIKPDREIFSLVPVFWTAEPIWDRYATLIAGPIGRQLINSLIIAVGSTLLAVIAGGLAAYAMSRFAIKGKYIISVVILAVQLLPPVVVIIPLFSVYRQLGLINSYLGVILAHMALSVALAVWMIRGFLASVPVELDEAAMIDGASRGRILISIIFPIALPGIATSAVYAFIASWNELMIAMTFLQDERMKTMPGALQQFSSQYGTDWGGIMTGSTLFAIPVIIFFILIRRQLVVGMAAGAVKG